MPCRVQCSGCSLAERLGRSTAVGPCLHVPRLPAPLPRRNARSSPYRLQCTQCGPGCDASFTCTTCNSNGTCKASRCSYGEPRLQRGGGAGRLPQQLMLQAACPVGGGGGGVQGTAIAGSRMLLLPALFVAPPARLLVRRPVQVRTPAQLLLLSVVPFMRAWTPDCRRHVGRQEVCGLRGPILRRWGRCSCCDVLCHADSAAVRAVHAACRHGDCCYAGALMHCTLCRVPLCAVLCGVALRTSNGAVRAPATGREGVHTATCQP